MWNPNVHRRPALFYMWMGIVSGTVILWTVSVNKLPIYPVSGKKERKKKKRPPGLTSHLVISLLSVPPCSASGPLSSILWLANQTGSHLGVSQGLREPCWGDMVTVASNHEVNRKMPFLLLWDALGEEWWIIPMLFAKYVSNFSSRANAAGAFLKGSVRDHKLTAPTQCPLLQLATFKNVWLKRMIAPHKVQLVH